MKKLLFVLLACALPVGASAQTWPHKPVRMMLSLGPGSGADIGARLYADKLTKMWGPTANFVGHPYSLDKLPYDPNELVPVARVTGTVVTLGVPASMNVSSLKELLDMAKQKQGFLN